ncbi:unnamed protein product [Lampetra fluviatilis]
MEVEEVAVGFKGRGESGGDDVTAPTTPITTTTTAAATTTTTNGEKKGGKPDLVELLPVRGPVVIRGAGLVPEGAGLAADERGLLGGAWPAAPLPRVGGAWYGRGGVAYGEGGEEPRRRVLVTYRGDSARQVDEHFERALRLQFPAKTSSRQNSSARAAAGGARRPLGAAGGGARRGGGAVRRVVGGGGGGGDGGDNGVDAGDGGDRVGFYGAGAAEGNADAWRETNSVTSISRIDAIVASITTTTTASSTHHPPHSPSPSPGPAPSSTQRPSRAAGGAGARVLAGRGFGGKLQPQRALEVLVHLSRAVAAVRHQHAPTRLLPPFPVGHTPSPVPSPAHTRQRSRWPRPPEEAPLIRRKPRPFRRKPRPADDDGAPDRK